MVDSQATALQLSEQRFRSLFTQNPDAVFAYSLDGVCKSLNPATEVVIGLPESELLGQHLRSIFCEPACTKQDAERTESAFQRAANGDPNSFMIRLLGDGKAYRDLELTMMPIVVNEEVDGVFGIAKDVTARVSVEEQLHILERSLEASSNGVMITDVREDEKRVIYVNPSFSRITGYLKQDILGHLPVILTGDETDTMDIEQIRATVGQGNNFSGNVRAYRRDGTPFWNQLFLSPVRDADQRVTHVIGIMNDISKRVEQESQLAYQATHDVLTGLGNRALFNDHLAHDLQMAARNGQTLAVLFIDLDEFKPINDTLGHKIGDQVLINVAGRLQQGLRAVDTLTRFGGDEFVLVLPSLRGASEAEEIASRLLQELSLPHQVSGHELYVSASIGIAVNRGGLDEPDQMLQHADMAMYKAKRCGRNSYQLYTEDLDRKLSG